MKRLARRPLFWLFVGPFVLVAAGFVVIQLVDHNVPTKANAATGIFEEGVPLSFVGSGAGTVKNIREENGGTATAYITNVWIEEEVAGVWQKGETNFKIVAANPAPVLPTLECTLPPPTEAYLERLGAKTSCEIGIKFLTGAAGKKGRYVLEFEEPSWCPFIWRKVTKAKAIES